MFQVEKSKINESLERDVDVEHPGEESGSGVFAAVEMQTHSAILSCASTVTVAISLLGTVGIYQQFPCAN